jgi:hypothetical protein
VLDEGPCELLVFLARVAQLLLVRRGPKRYGVGAREVVLKQLLRGQDVVEVSRPVTERELVKPPRPRFTWAAKQSYAGRE